MKFNEIKFENRKDGMDGTRAVVFFKNGFGASIITGTMFYTSDSEPYEIAVLTGNKDNYSITYSTPVTSDVLGYQTAEDVEKTLGFIEDLPPSN